MKDFKICRTKSEHVICKFSLGTKEMASSMTIAKVKVNFSLKITDGHWEDRTTWRARIYLADIKNLENEF